MEEKKVRQVHESQEERQHVRVRLQGSLRLRMQSPVKGIFSLEDVSLGGLSFVAGQVNLTPGTLCHGEIVFRLGRANLSMPVSFKVIYQEDSNQRVGGQYTVIDQQNTDLLRLLISNYLAGELTELDDVIDNMKRENYVATRKGKQKPTARGWLDRARALFGSLLFFIVGLLAFLVVAYKLYQHAFLTRADDAWVSLPGKTVMMPENGYVQLLLPEGATQVERGQPLLTVSSRLVARLNNGVLLDNLDPKQVRALVDAAVFEVTLNSPCDCDIADLMVRDGEFVQEDTALIRLVDPSGPNLVTALFEGNADSLGAAVGDAVTVRFMDGHTDAGATISQLVRDEESGLLRMQIVTQRELSTSDQNQPVSVTVHPAWFPVL
ncbi:PilZ domain-containing protein [Alcanivorax sp. DP30]|uniref:PilZ domain-containing protein n=1 Tax=Alcanivorax sp. DP30 TaxID=2606217 RepID=UPI00136B1A7B|nr:PilZ domain-containing protein [Alcanivorax sp. DP30]MZR61269.1 alginate biosynthesis protein [Alcanivorax sp. DP30]